MNETTRKPEGQVPVGTLVTLPLYTDTIPAVVVASTATTTTIDELLVDRSDPAKRHSDGGYLPVIVVEADGSEPRRGKARTRRLRKDGTYRDGRGMPAMIFGRAFERVDYRQ